jgi:hypothetical protein
VTSHTDAPQRTGSIPTYAWVCLGLSLLLAGPVGLTIVGFVFLVRMPPPQSITGQRWRIMGLASGWTAVALGALGGIVGFVLGLSSPPTLVFAVIEGGLIGAVPGIVLGAVIGLMLVFAHTHRVVRE